MLAFPPYNYQAQNEQQEHSELKVDVGQQFWYFALVMRIKF